ncbi:MAG: aspartate/glutamate racemase family protein [Granulosicoccus sp.]
MKNPTRLALIHATRLAIDPILSACESAWPQVEPVSILDESLAIDRSKDKHLTDELSNRIITLCRHAEGLGSDGVLFTCSAFGEAIEKAALSSAVPVLKPNEAMFEKALSIGERITMIYTFPPAVVGMEKEFADEVVRRQSSATIQSVFADGARQAVEEGNTEKHNEIIVNTISTVKGADVILLAHFSMATAASDANAATNIPVISSPATAIEKIKLLVNPS